MICHEGTEEGYGCNCTLSLTSALGIVVVQRHNLAALFRDKDPVRIVQMGPRAGLSVCGKSRLHMGSDSDSCRPYQVAIPITPSQYFIKCPVLVTLLR